MAKFLRIVAWTLVIGAVFVGLGRLTVIRWWHIPVGDPYLEASIAPTLRGGDWVILWRGTAPSAGSLVLCPEPTPVRRLTLGRLIGERGDHVALVNAGLTINGRRPDTEGGCDRFTTRDPSSHQETVQPCRMEVLAGSTHLRGEPPAEGARPADAELDVPEGHVFLVSDNRLFPWDSRDYGPVPRESCRETVIFRLLSKDGFFDVANRLTLIR